MIRREQIKQGTLIRYKQPFKRRIRLKKLFSDEDYTFSICSYKDGNIVYEYHMKDGDILMVDDIFNGHISFTPMWGNMPDKQFYCFWSDRFTESFEVITNKELRKIKLKKLNSKNYEK